MVEGNGMNGNQVQLWNEWEWWKVVKLMGMMKCYGTTGRYRNEGW